MHPTMGGIVGRPETICLIMVGLPGRGKTAIAARTARYLKGWLLLLLLLLLLLMVVVVVVSPCRVASHVWMICLGLLERERERADRYNEKKLLVSSCSAIPHSSAIRFLDRFLLHHHFLLLLRYLLFPWPHTTIIANTINPSFSSSPFIIITTSYHHSSSPRKYK